VFDYVAPPTVFRRGTLYGLAACVRLSPSGVRRASSWPSLTNTSASAATAAPSPANRATSSPKQRPVGRVAQREVLTLTLGMVVGSRRTCRRQYGADKGSDRDSRYLLVAPARRSVAHRNGAFEAYEVG
jgi:hypothetical protein